MNKLIEENFGEITPGEVLLVDKKDEHFGHFGIYGGSNIVYCFYEGKAIETTVKKFIRNKFCCYTVEFNIDHLFNRKERQIRVHGVRKDGTCLYSDYIEAPNTYRLYSKKQTLKRIKNLATGKLKKHPDFEDCEQLVIWCKSGLLKGETESISFVDSACYTGIEY